MHTVFYYVFWSFIAIALGPYIYFMIRKAIKDAYKDIKNQREEVNSNEKD